MQTMEMGPAEATLTQMSAIPSASSSSYFLQLDPSGQVDILESSLVLNKPDMADETVYEIQLDPFMMDERNVEIINLQNLQNTVTFQPEFLEEHQFTTSFDTQVTYQVDDFNLNQLLMSTAAVAMPAPETMTEIKSEPLEDETVPDFTVETEIVAESEQLAAASSNSANTVMMAGSTMQDHVILQNQQLEYIPMVQDEVDAAHHKPHSDPVYNLNLSAEESMLLPSGSFVQEAVVSNQLKEQIMEGNEMDASAMEDVKPIIDSKSETDKTKARVTEEIIKEEPPDNIMEFTEEAVIPPLTEILPSKPDSPVLPPIITLYDDEDDDDDSEDESALHVSNFLYEGMDPDDELYISYLTRPDTSKTSMCVICYKWFEGSSELEEHLKSVHQDNMKLYGCKRCGKQFWSRFLRQRHEKQHRYDLKGPIERYLPKNRPFDYYERKHYFKRLRPAPFTEQYRDHIRLIHAQIKSSEFDCIQCDKCFQSEEELREHYEEEHSLQTCVHCRKQVGNSKDLRKHEKEVHGLFTVKKNYPGGAWKLWDSWECEEMKEKDDRLVNLFLYHNYTKRIKNEKTSSEETVQSTCDKFEEFGCEEVTVTEFEVTKPIEKKNPVEKEKRSAKDKGSKTKASSAAHPNEPTPKARKSDPMPPTVKLLDYDKIEFLEEPKSEPLVKRNDLPFKCDTCRTSFDNDIDLQRHVKTHSIRTMAYMCQYCGRGFATHSNRKEHERIHTGDKPYVCPICSRAFVQISNLKKHIQTHKDKNNLQCSTCNKQFVKESSLILHQRAHSQDRKFRCHICDRAYNYASLLKRHMRIHTGENPYSCEDCGMQFHELVSLHYHRKKVHTGERPHRCEQCGRAFILSSDLKKHLKIHLRDGNSIKSSGASGNAKSKSKSAVGSEFDAATTNGAITDSLTPPMENDVTTPMEEDYTNSSIIEFHQADVEMPEQPTTDRILVISENDLLNVTRNEENETKADGVIHQESTNNAISITTATTYHENDLIQLSSTEAVP